MLPSGVATLGQGALADTAVQPNDSPTFNALTVNGNAYPSAGALSNRNLIINGAMGVAQRGTSTAGVVGDGFYSCDRFKTILGSLGTYTVSQAADGPTGFANSYRVAVTTANASPAAASYHLITSKFEGRDLQWLSKGTPSAKQLTASFWVKSNVTGNYVLNILDLDNSRQIGSTYTISVSGTWQYVTVVFPADTTGTFNNDNGPSLEIGWWLASGANYNSGATPTAWETTTDTDRNAGSNVNLGATIGNYFQITGVQLEVGDTATPFEHRSYGQELIACQRYFTRWGFGSTNGRLGVGGFGTPTSAEIHVPLHPVMRSVPTMSAPNRGSILDFGAAWHAITAVTLSVETTRELIVMTATLASSFAIQGDACALGGGGSTFDYLFDAEL
jgi:hypothetical protein